MAWRIGMGRFVRGRWLRLLDIAGIELAVLVDAFPVLVQAKHIGLPHADHGDAGAGWAEGNGTHPFDPEIPRGCFGIFVRIFIPLSVTPMVIIGISTFMGYWNSYLWPTLTIIKNTQWQQVMQVLRILNGSKAGDYGVVVAAALMALVIPVTLFAVFQKYIMQGIAISGIK